MARALPPDVVVLDTDGLLHARISRGKKNSLIQRAKSYRLPEGTFMPAVVTPELTNEGGLADVLRRLRLESGKWDKVSVLLPDSWFRTNIVEIPALPERNHGEADEMIRWSLKRTLPIPPDSLRVAWEVLSRKNEAAKVLVLAAVDATLTAIERIFSAAGIDVVMIEPIGLNIWNAIAAREQAATGDRLFLYLRDNDFTTAVFRGAQPLFVRSRNLDGDRTVEQEMRLSATYLRDSMQSSTITRCYVAGNLIDASLVAVIADEFSADVTQISLRDVTDETPNDVAGFEAELTACTGVFTA